MNMGMESMEVRIVRAHPKPPAILPAHSQKKLQVRRVAFSVTRKEPPIKPNRTLFVRRIVRRSLGMADPMTPNLGLTQPTVGGSFNIWGGELNNDLAIIDGLFPDRVLQTALLPVATEGSLGIVEPDGTSIVIDDGVISAVGGEVELSVTYHGIPASGTNAAVIKNSPGSVTGWSAFNEANYPIYVKLCDTAETPVPGTTPVTKTIAMQAGSPSELGLESPIKFVNGIGVYTVKGIADSNTTGILADDCLYDIFWQ